MGETYIGSEVDSAAGDGAVAGDRDVVRSPRGSGMSRGIGGFGGLLAFPPGFREPLPVAASVLAEDPSGPRVRVA